MHDKVLIGKIFLKRGIIKKKELNEALKVQKSNNLHLGEILKSLGYIEKEDILIALILQNHIPYISINKLKLKEKVINIIPKHIAVKYNIVPFEKVGNILSIAISEPLDIKKRKELKDVTHCKIAPFLTSKSEVDHALSNYYF